MFTDETNDAGTPESGSQGSQAGTPVVTNGPSKLDTVLSYIDAALQYGSALAGGPIGQGLSLADLALKAVEKLKATYEAETGQPLDLSKIPTEDHV